MNFSNLSKSQLSRDEMRAVTGGGSRGISDEDDGGGGGDLCHAHCSTSADCDTANGCYCTELHGAMRCVK